MLIEDVYSSQVGVGESLRGRSDLAQKYISRGDLFALGELYVQEKWQTDNLFAELAQALRAPASKAVLFKPQTLALAARDRFLNSQRGHGVFEVAERHYDLGNELFDSMLDESRSYTCGYWLTAKSLAEAQTAKLDLICRKLSLSPGMKVLDIGCGWGNFAEFAARNFGVNVVGVTISKEQAAFATSRCANLPVRIEFKDYLEIEGKFDRVVSIEMIEAVGRKNLTRYFGKVDSLLAADGLFLLQVISADSFSRTSHAPLDSFILYLLKYIFPNGYLPSLKLLVDPLMGKLRLEDLHNFSSDYALTLDAWHTNFMEGWPKLARRFRGEFKRMWKFYLEGCRACFAERHVQLYQAVYSKARSIHGYQSYR